MDSFIGKHNFKEITTLQKTERSSGFKCLILLLLVNINLPISDQPRKTVGGSSQEPPWVFYLRSKLKTKQTHKRTLHKTPDCGVSLVHVASLVSLVSEVDTGGGELHWMAPPASPWSCRAEGRIELVQQVSFGVDVLSSLSQWLVLVEFLNTIIDYSPSTHLPLFTLLLFFFLGSSRNDFNYLHNQILIAASVQVCSHRWLGLFSLALGDREAGCFKMRTSWLYRALI